MSRAKITNYLYRDLVHSKIGLALESGRKMGENKALTLLHVLTEDSHAPSHFPTRGLHPLGVRAGRGAFQTLANVHLPLEFSGCDTCRTSVGFRLDCGSLGCFTKCKSGFQVNRLTRVSGGARRVSPPFARRVSSRSGGRVYVADCLSLSHFQIPVKFNINLFILNFSIFQTVTWIKLISSQSQVLSRYIFIVFFLYSHRLINEIKNWEKFSFLSN